jgi:hypothetical protein
MIVIILALCVAAAGAATVNTNLVVSKATLQIATITPQVYATCPTGYECMTEADATSQLGTYTKYSDAICGYKQSTATFTAVVRTPQYCVKKVENQYPAICPEGCSCMMESDAKEKFQGNYKQCSDQPCYTVVTGSAQLKAYCFRQGTTTPVCPEGCSCISDATATAKGGTWTRCSDTVCGYEPGTATLAAVVQVPKFCMKQVTTTPVCPEGCVCITKAMAQDRYGDFTQCSSDICGYAQDQTPEYCIKQASTTPTCPEGCVCLSDEKAHERYGTYTRCTADVCGKEIIQPVGAAPYSVPQYCVKQGSTPVCPEGCACISDEDAKLKGLTDRCDNSQTPCGYRTSDATATTAAQRIPLYCYKIPTTTTTPQVCPQGCYCLQVAEADLKFGPNNYTRCQAEPCGSDPSATTANGISRYCFKPTVTPTPPACPQGCACTTDEIAKIKGLTPCRGVRTSCGYDEKQQPLYCFEQIPSPTCVYDYQKNVCTGTCPEGYTCGLLASRKDATGKVDYAVCGCTGQPTGQCTFDKEKQTCTGTCQNGGTCAIVGKKVDDKTGEVFVVCGCPPPSTEQCTFDKEKQTCTGTCDSGAACTVIGKKTDDAGNVYVFCGCPQPSSCVYDYSKDACVGTCTNTGDICQLNTIYRDPTTGKVTYAECHCKGSGAETCTCDTTTGSCTGSCADNRACTMVEKTTDNAGKILCSKCECRDTCVLTANNECSGTCPSGEPCTRVVTKDDNGQEKVSCNCGGSQPGTPAGVAPQPQGIFESIASFFSRLFGGK